LGILNGKFSQIYCHTSGQIRVNVRILIFSNRSMTIQQNNLTKQFNKKTFNKDQNGHLYRFGDLNTKRPRIRSAPGAELSERCQNFH
jgi:hypothetical protein